MALNFRASPRLYGSKQIIQSAFYGESKIEATNGCL